MLHNNEMKVFIICMGLLLISVYLTLNLVDYTFAHPEKNKQQDYDCFLDKNGNHYYYERSLIEKKEFMDSNPQIPLEQVRSIKYLLKFLFSKNIIKF